MVQREIMWSNYVIYMQKNVTINSNALYNEYKPIKYHARERGI